MCRKIVWGALLLTTWLALTPEVGWAQGAVGYAPADPILPLPLGSTRPEDGGPYFFGRILYMRMNNPLKHQPVAYRGFIAVDDSVLGPGTAGTFVGPRTEAFNVRQVSGPGSYQLGSNAGLGWKFKDGTALTLDWIYLTTAEFRAVATPYPFGLRVGSDFSSQFLTAFVFNFPPEYAGPLNKIAVGSPNAVAGIWNGATTMTEEFQQRFQQYTLTYRVPIHEEECYRIQGLIGPRFAWVWERYKWTTTSTDNTGAFGSADIGVYTNIVSNRMYGTFIGTNQEYYVGHGFAVSLDTRAALYINTVKERAKYEFIDKFLPPQNKRARREFTLVPGFDASLGLKWYPTEFIELQAGYNLLTFFNTISSPRPIDLNYSNLTPKWESQFRYIDGLFAGIALIF